MGNLNGLSVEWRKSSYSGTNGGECLEAGRGLPGAVPVRDSKLSDSPVLSFPSAGWGEFLATVKDGRFSA
ncbi:DUF397 domain-containing protein [Streptomyces bohaiensis]|uniref:DUF397 domain-containing protein n=1 Tax=Streptomyces bohaiensis TaxID=1431344 RepID=A0ABX1CAP3_9ACTN|nr:DUF397 domain-containing protein [Streptomyces bohaiensis]NJQ14457.1 DUF397 domain-containing protein [Streptomyces bohaiensis]